MSGTAQATVRTLALAVCGVMLIASLAVGWQLLTLRDVAVTIERDGAGLTKAGGALEDLAALPLVGESAGRAARDLREAGEHTIEVASTTKHALTALAITTVLAFGVLPFAVVFALDAWARRRAAREAALERLLADRDGFERLAPLLAARALANQPLERLLQVSEDPWGAFAAGEYAQLAQLTSKSGGPPSPAAKA